MTFSLNADMERLVRDKVDSGLYPSPDAVLQEALRLLEARDEKERLRRDIQVGLEQLRQGQSVPGKQVFDELEQRSQERRQNQAA